MCHSSLTLPGADEHRPLAAWSGRALQLSLARNMSQAMNGQLEFFNVDEFEIMNAGEHFMCTDIEWDPTGGVLMQPWSSTYCSP